MSDFNLLKYFMELSGNLGNMSVSILEHYLSNVLGEETIAQIREPYESSLRLAKMATVLSETDNKLADKIPAEFLNTRLDSPDIFIQASDAFVRDINVDELRDELLSQFGNVSETDVTGDSNLEEYVDLYVETLRREINATAEDASFTERITAESLLDIKDRLQDFAEQQLSEEKTQTDLLEKIIEVLTQNLSSTHFEINVSSRTDTQPSEVEVLSQTESSDEELILAFLACEWFDEGTQDQIFEKFDYPPIPRDDVETRSRKFIKRCLRSDGMVTELIAYIGEKYARNSNGFQDGFWTLLEVWIKYSKKEIDSHTFRDYFMSLSGEISEMQKQYKWTPLKHVID
jgi:hypothetical protein